MFTKWKVFSVPGDMKVNESDAQYLVRKFSELQSQNADMSVHLANAESKCRELAAELSAVDKIHNEAVFITDDHYEQCPPEVQKMIRSLDVLQIPTYNDFLAEVRAQGVEMFADYIALYNSNSFHHARSFAAQLRKGVAL